MVVTDGYTPWLVLLAQRTMGQVDQQEEVE